MIWKICPVVFDIDKQEEIEFISILKYVTDFFGSAKRDDVYKNYFYTPLKYQVQTWNYFSKKLTNLKLLIWNLLEEISVVDIFLHIPNLYLLTINHKTQINVKHIRHVQKYYFLSARGVWLGAQMINHLILVVSYNIFSVRLLAFKEID